MDVVANHPMLKDHPQFYKAVLDFQTFLRTAMEDLEVKQTSLKAQRKLVKHKVRVKHYLGCQIYMLRKYIARLGLFEKEIRFRLAEIINNNKMLEGDVVPPTEVKEVYRHVNKEEDEEGDEVKDTSDSLGEEETAMSCSYREVPIDVGNLEVTSDLSGICPTPMTSKQRLSDGDMDANEVATSSFVYASDDAIEDEEVSDESPRMFESDKVDEQPKGKFAVTGNCFQLSKLLADMNKMKLRCKHMLDVTDRYCVLNSETDLKLDLDKNDVMGSLSCGSPWVSRPSSACSSTVESPMSENAAETASVDGMTTSDLMPKQLPASISDRGLAKITLESFGSHLSVLAKTYIRRHSHDPPSDKLYSGSESINKTTND